MDAVVAVDAVPPTAGVRTATRFAGDSSELAGDRPPIGGLRTATDSPPAGGGSGVSPATVPLTLTLTLTLALTLTRTLTRTLTLTLTPNLNPNPSPNPNQVAACPRPLCRCFRALTRARAAAAGRILVAGRGPPWLFWRRSGEP